MPVSIALHIRKMTAEKLQLERKKKKIDKNNNATNWVTGCEASMYERETQGQCEYHLIWNAVSVCTHNLLLTAVLLLDFNCYKWTRGGWLKISVCSNFESIQSLNRRFFQPKIHFLLKFNSKSTIQIIICICSFSWLVFIIHKLWYDFSGNFLA